TADAAQSRATRLRLASAATSLHRTIRRTSRSRKGLAARRATRTGSTAAQRSVVRGSAAASHLSAYPDLFGPRRHRLYSKKRVRILRFAPTDLQPHSVLDVGTMPIPRPSSTRDQASQGG